MRMSPARVAGAASSPSVQSQAAGEHQIDLLRRMGAGGIGDAAALIEEADAMLRIEDQPVGADEFGGEHRAGDIGRDLGILKPRMGPVDQRCRRPQRRAERMGIEGEGGQPVGERREQRQRLSASCATARPMTVAAP